MPDYILWQKLEPKRLKITNHKHVTTVMLERDENYNLLVNLECHIPKTTPSPLNLESYLEHVIGPLNELIGEDEQLPNNEYKIDGIVIDKISTNRIDRISCSGMAAKVESYFKNDVAGNGEFVIFWMLNCSSDLSYPEAVTIKGKEKIEYEWSSFAQDRYELDTINRMSRSAIQLKYNEVEVLFGKLSDESLGPQKGSFLRLKNIESTKDVDIKDLASILSLILGVTLIPIGSTEYNRASSPVINVYNSTFQSGVERVFSEMELPILPIRINDHYVRKIEPDKQINHFISNYLDLRDNFDLQKILWYISYARSQDPLVKMQPLATALDLLCTKYFEKIKNTMLPKEKFKVIASEVETIFDKHLKDEEIKTAMLTRFQNINNISMNKRHRSIFTDLDMSLSDFEQNALKSRNIAVHGKTGDIDAVDMTKKSSAFYLLVIRLLLKLLKVPFYIDWSVQGTPVNKMEEAQKGSYRVRRL